MSTPQFPPLPDELAVRRALLSVSDKAGLLAAARSLTVLGVELVSTGGTRAAIAGAGLAVKEVADLTGFPEMMDGRVKTLHPMVHGGLLAVRDAPDHALAMRDHGVMPIDLLYVNLYPFEATVAAGASAADCVETIDIGGPAMIRSAAKNHGYVAVCTAPEDLAEVIEALETEGKTPLALRQRLAARAFARTAAYDAAISQWFAAQLGEAYPARLNLSGERIETLRYGENPHQSAAFYRAGPARPGVVTARQRQGKALSYNNIADTDAALELVAEFDRPACAIIKHANPCGVAVSADLTAAYDRALACDPVSAFGGIVALNRDLDDVTAGRIIKTFTEVVIAPDASESAQAMFASKPNLRLLLTGTLPDPRSGPPLMRSVAGGWLIQDRDTRQLTAADLAVVTQRAPTADELDDMLFAFQVARHVKSNAIVFARAGRTLGIGAGQTNRKDSARIAALRAADFGLNLSGSACASEAFFPFADGLIQAAEAGATAVIQPGGSQRDPEVIAAADAAGMAMVFTGVRVFRH